RETHLPQALGHVVERLVVSEQAVAELVVVDAELVDVLPGRGETGRIRTEEGAAQAPDLSRVRSFDRDERGLGKRERQVGEDRPDRLQELAYLGVAASG